MVKIITESFLENCQKALFIPNTLLQLNKTKAKFTQQIPEFRSPNTFAIQFHVNLHVVGLFFGSLFSFICNSLNQYLTARIHKLTNKWYLPRSPYTLESSVGRSKTLTSKSVHFFDHTNTLKAPYFSTIQSDWLDLRIKHFERGLPCHFTKITQNSDTVACCSFTFSCQEANTLTDTKFSCKRIAEVGITINNFYFIPSRNRFSFLPRNPPFLNTMTSDFSVLMDKECSLHIEFKWFSWFCNPMEILHKSAKSSANSSKNSSTKPG